jgi:hypothetical protein
LSTASNGKVVRQSTNLSNSTQGLLINGLAQAKPPHRPQSIQLLSKACDRTNAFGPDKETYRAQDLKTQPPGDSTGILFVKQYQWYLFFHGQGNGFCFSFVQFSAKQGYQSHVPHLAYHDP